MDANLFDKRSILVLHFPFLADWSMALVFGLLLEVRERMVEICFFCPFFNDLNI